MHRASPFLRVARQPRPGLDELLLALAAQFRPVDARYALERLDDYSRRLFGLGAQHADAQAGCVLHAVRHELGMRPTDLADPESLLLDRVLERRRGHPLLLAAVAVELARRAGVPATVCSSPARWFAVFAEPAGSHLALVDLGGGVAAPDRRVLQRHCAHEVAIGVLEGLRQSYDACVRPSEAARAAELIATLSDSSQR
jgi:hypothetical protein